MRFPDRKAVERIRKEYPAGCRIVLDRMEDAQAPEPGTQGTVLAVDDTGTVIPAWDTGGRLGVVFGEDACHKIRTEEEAKITLDWYGKHQPGEDARCPRCGAVMPGRISAHALSRWARITVCDMCGTFEALEKAGLMEVIPMMNWTAVTEPQEGGGPWKG